MSRGNLVGIRALAAQFVSDNYGAPTMLMALLYGMALNLLSKIERCAKGLNFIAKILLLGVSLLGARMIFKMISAISIANGVITFMAVLAMIGFGIILSKWLNIDEYFASLTSGAVAIYGISAALAIAAMLTKIKSVTEGLYLRLQGLRFCKLLQ